MIACSCSVAQSCPTLCDPMFCSKPGFTVFQSLRACSNSCPFSRWCHPTISPSVTLLSSWPQSFPASESFPVSRLFTSGGQGIGASVLASVLPVSIQGSFFFFRIDWFDLLGTLKSPPAQQLESINTLVLSLLCGPALTPVHDYWNKHSFDYTDLC